MGRYNRMGRGRSRRGNSSSLFSIILSLILAVAIGYVGTKYIIYPLVLQDKGAENVSTDGLATTENPITNPAIEPNDPVLEENPVEEPTKQAVETGKKVVEDQQEVKVVKGYSLQYGIFTDKNEATNLIATLSQKGANVYIFETGTEYKVLGNAYASEEKAKVAAEILKQNGTEVSVVEY